MLGRDYPLAGDLFLHRREDPLLLLVDESCGIVGFNRDLLDQLLGKLEFGVADIELFNIEIRDRSNFLGVEELLQHHSTFRRANLDDVLLGPKGPLGQRATPGVEHGAKQQVVGLGTALVGRKEIRLVVVDRIDCVLRNKGNDVDRSPRLLLKRLQLIGGEEDELALSNS